MIVSLQDQHCRAGGRPTVLSFWAETRIVLNMMVKGQVENQWKWQPLSWSTMDGGEPWRKGGRLKLHSGSLSPGCFPHTSHGSHTRSTFLQIIHTILHSCPTELDKWGALTSPCELCCLLRLKTEKQKPSLPWEWANLSDTDKCGFHMEGQASHHLSKEFQGDQRAVSSGPFFSPAVMGTSIYRA